MAKMAKTKKKKNYRLRKSVRRTLGALFMISAIIVAAIPFPDAVATNGINSQSTSGNNATDSTTQKPTLSTISALVYDTVVDPTLDNDEKPKSYDRDVNVGIDLNGTDTNEDDVKTAYTLRYTEEGIWQYEEHFKYYLLKDDKDNDTKEAILCQYNNDYTVKNIKLASTINSGSYVSVLGSDFKEYFDESTVNDKIIVHDLTWEEYKEGDANEDYNLFSKYFSGQITVLKQKIQQYETDYKKYEDELAKYNAATDKTGMTQPTEPDIALVKVEGDPRKHISGSLQGQYFCDYVISSQYILTKDTSGTDSITDDYATYKDIDLEDKGFEMVAVENPLAGSSGTPIIYIAKAINVENSKNDAGIRIDNSGFLYTSLKDDTYTLRGIAEHAFSGVTTYMTLQLPESIHYIGDEAFMGSSVGEIDITNVSQIGNRAFMNSQLSKITMSPATTVIGTEAFRTTHLTSIDLPAYLTKIGKGAFAYNDFLTTIIINNTTVDLEIGDCAFFECKALNSQKLTDKKIGKIGKGAFAVETKDNGSCTRFEFPNSISKGLNAKGTDGNKGMAGYILAGRQSLKQVIMPDNLGLNDETTIDSSIFKGCNNLEYVIFPDSCGYVKFEPNMFMDVTNADFYVQGPELNKQNKEALPRTSTWNCVMNYASDTDYRYVPYVYYINNQKYYEVSKGDYRLLIDPQGKLTSCILLNSSANLDPFSIPGVVGNIKVTGIAEGCFDEKLLNKIISLRIEDGGAIKEIANNAFADAPNMTSVYLGDSVEIVGSEAFRNCINLEEVTFGKNINKIGERAFQGCCALEKVTFDTPDSLNNFPVSNIGKEAFDTYYFDEDTGSETGTYKLTFVGAVSPNYGPFAWAMDSENFVNRNAGVRVCYETGNPYNQKIILDNRNNYPTLVDYLHYNDLNDIKTKRLDNGETVTLMDKLNNGLELTVMDGFIVDAVSNLVIPEGIKSIDVKGFITNESIELPDAKYASIGNDNNVTRYLSDDNNRKTEYMNHGLFNGECNDGDVTAVKSIGNDRLKSVKMYSVKYLPNEHDIKDYLSGRSRSAGDPIAENGLSGGAFYSCENLETVSLGSIEDIGQLPFEGCYKLNSVAFGSDSTGNTTNYIPDNRIIYEKLGENNYRIVQCLGSRGDSELPKDVMVNVDYDSKLANVSEIAVGAFSDCPYLRKVNFEGNNVLTAIPDKCFLGDDALPGATNYGMGTITLPETIRSIGHLSMAYCDDIELIIKGKEVSLASDAFTGTERVLVKAYEDTAAYNTASGLMGVEVEKLPVGETTYKVQFYDYDFKTTIGPEQEVKAGGSAVEPPTPTRAGYKFVGWSTDEWKANVSEDLDVIAMYETDTTSTGGSGNGGNNNGGSGSGSTNNGTNVNGGIDTNGDGIPDVDKDGNKLYKLTVTNGEGGGYYKAGQTVTIKAGNAPSGSGFAYWSCSNQNLIFEDYTDWTTTLTMIASDVTVICNFRGFYTLEVEYGSGSGSYAAGAKVAISAVEAPQGRKFASWKIKEGQPTIEDSKKATTFITMPTGNVKISATYMDTGKNSVSSNTASSSNNTSVIITKPGISDKDKASAHVSGSSDNFIVKISESLDAADEVQRALQKKYSDMSRIKYFAMDISLYDAKGENKITNTDGLKVNITIPIPDALREYAGNNRVGAVVNGELETLNPKFTTINGVPSISFTATHFSPYTIYVDTGNMVVSDTLDSTPKTGDIHPKWFLSLGLACISIILFTKRDKRYTVKA